MQRRPRAFINHPQPGDQLAIGQPLLIGGIDLPDLVRVLGPLPARGLGSSGRGRGQAVPAQPSLECPLRGDRRGRMMAAQLDLDAPGPPTGVLAAQVQGRFQKRWGRSRVAPSGLIPGLQADRDTHGPRLEDATCQVSDRAARQVELLSDLGGGGPESDHASQDQPPRKIRGAWHRNQLPDPKGIRSRDCSRDPSRTKPSCRDFARNLVSGDRASPSQDRATAFIGSQVSHARPVPEGSARLSRPRRMADRRSLGSRALLA